MFGAGRSMAEVWIAGMLDPEEGVGKGPRGRAGSGRSHFWNRPRPAEPLIRPSSITTSPRDSVITG